MDKFKILFFFLWFSFDTSAQKHDYHWIIGLDHKNAPVVDTYGLVKFDFNYPNRPKMIKLPKTDMYFTGTNSSMSDSSGCLLFYSNGSKIFGPNHQLILNGDTLTPYYEKTGQRNPQGIVSLPFPKQKNQYIFLNKEIINNGFIVATSRMFSGIVDMQQNNKMGKVILKRNIVIEDTLDFGYITAARHANGRDWWVIQQEYNTNRFYRFYVGPEGIVLKGSQTVGTPVEDGGGQVTFSPDGSKFIRVKKTRTTEPNYLYIYDFDRCTGLLCNQRTTVFDYAPSKFGIGVACSPDSRYLYVTETIYVYQYDLTAPDIFATKTVVGEYDGFLSAFGLPLYYWQSQLAPDGRIYIGGLNSAYHLSYIQHPTRKGSACGFTPHGVYLKVLNQYSMPNHPNFRLGPLDGSPCDTLGLDNRPLANFRWEHEDSTDIRQVTFTDLSAYEPTAWHWTFGDGGSSTERYPAHRYAQDGVYTACLIVKNQFSSDTFCQKVYIGVAAQDNPEIQSRIEVWPNPFGERLVLALSTPELRSPVLSLFDVTGRLVLSERLEFGLNEVNTTELEKGLYFWVVEAAQGTGTPRERVKSGKVIKL